MLWHSILGVDMAQVLPLESEAVQILAPTEPQHCNPVCFSTITSACLQLLTKATELNYQTVTQDPMPCHPDGSRVQCS